MPNRASICLGCVTVQGTMVTPAVIYITQSVQVRP